VQLQQLRTFASSRAKIPALDAKAISVLKKPDQAILAPRWPHG
jgi:hypothetical protein